MFLLIRKSVPKYFIFIIAIMLCGCIHYREDWDFEKNGSGSVHISCEPSKNWQKYAKISNWEAAATLLLPNYSAISQMCARAGVTIEQCKYRKQSGKPKIDIILSFKSLRSLAKCNLFSDRILQWHKSGKTISYFYKLLLNQSHFAAGKSSFVDRNWLADGLIEFSANFPGKVAKVKGAERKGKKISLAFPASFLVDNSEITISATIKTVPPVFRWFLFISVLIVFLILSLFFLYKWFKRFPDPPPKEKKPGPDNQFYGQYW